MLDNEQINKIYFELFEKSLNVKDDSIFWHHIRSQTPFEEYRIALRLHLDVYYSNYMNKTRSYQACLDAGYFDDSSWNTIFLNLDNEASKLLTPIQIIKDNLALISKDDYKPLAVLLTTG